LGRGKRFIWKAMKAKKMEAVTNKDHFLFCIPDLRLTIGFWGSRQALV
jgi:hypothetical protein